MKDEENLGNYVIILDKRDNVATALKDIKAGTYFLSDGQSESSIAVRELIRAGFKVSLGKIKKGSNVYKYGSVIGVAVKDIEPGDKVHIENIKSLVNK